MTSQIRTAALASIAIILSTTAAVNASETHEVTVKAANVSYNAENMVMKVIGQLSNPCTVAPRPTLNVTEKANVLALEIKADASNDNCIDMIGTQTYSLAFDIRSLKFDLQALKIDTEGTYTIIANDGALAITIDFSKVPFTRPFATNIIPRGVLAVQNDGRFTVAVSESEAFSVKSPLIDLHQFIGQPISLEGHVVSARRSGGLVGEASAEHPVLLVTGLSSTPH